MTMFSREQDFLRYMRMNTRSDFIQEVVGKMMEQVDCNELIYLPMMEGLSLSLDQMKRFERPDAQPSKYDRITPIISRATRRQDLDFFRDSRSHNQRHSIQVRVLYHKKIAFDAKEVRRLKKE